jgi:hypothetical protein
LADSSNGNIWQYHTKGTTFLVPLKKCRRPAVHKIAQCTQGVVLGQYAILLGSTVERIECGLSGFGYERGLL